MRHSSPSPPSTTRRRGLGFAGYALLSVLCLTGSGLAPLAADVQPLATASLEGQLILERQPSGHVLIHPDGRVQPLPLGDEARPHSLVSAGERWYVAAIENGTLALVAGSALGIERLAAPGPLTAAPHAAVEVLSPTPLVDEQGLRGLIWLAGETAQSLAVRAAAYRDGRWETPQTVSPPGPGSQLALSVAPLGDGTWLAAWAAFDGIDDEIVWSRFDGKTWSAPAPVDAKGNEVPDITPQLHPTSAGALIAWSRYHEGQYSVALARFDGLRWSAPQLIGEPGTLYPTFSSLPGAPLMIVRQAMPRGWQILELGPEGEISKRSVVRSDLGQRPRIAARTADGLRLIWAAEEETITVLEPAADARR